MNANALILVALGSDHDVRFVQNEHLHFGQVKAAQFRAPVEQLARRTDQQMICQLRSSGNFI